MCIELFQKNAESMKRGIGVGAPCAERFGGAAAAGVAGDQAGHPPPFQQVAGARMYRVVDQDVLAVMLRHPCQQILQALNPVNRRTPAGKP